MNDIAGHYDALIDIDNDPVHDPKPLRDYMDKWDGQSFIDKMKLDKSKSVLEIGVGTGRLAIKVVPFCAKFVGIDISEKTVQRARQNLAGYNNVNILCDDFIQAGFDESFDVIYSSLTFMHIKEKQLAVRKVYELLNKNGIFALSVDKNDSDSIDAGVSQITVFPDKPIETQHYIENAGLTVIEKYETEFAHIFIAQKL